MCRSQISAEVIVQGVTVAQVWHHLTEGVPGRLSWTAKQDGTPAERLDVLHAWLVEDLPGGRVRILTQETQIGEPAAQLARLIPNPMLNGHQAWLDGLVRAASGRAR